MGTIRAPFGVIESLNKIAGASAGAVTRTITNGFSDLYIGTATKGKKLLLSIDEHLPAGAVLNIFARSASSEILLGTGFARQTFINSKTATKGTGNWIATFYYNGSAFVPYGKPTRPDIRKSV